MQLLKAANISAARQLNIASSMAILLMAMALAKCMSRSYMA